MSHLVGDERYHDRLTYDGLWENNLYQFFRIVSPIIQFDLPKPFKLEKDVTYKKRLVACHLLSGLGFDIAFPVEICHVLLN